MFDPGTAFQPTLMFVSYATAYPSEAPFSSLGLAGVAVVSYMKLSR